MRVTSNEPVDNILIGVDTVFIRSNIIRNDYGEFNVWEYDEYQVSKDDFIAKLQQDNEVLKVEQKQTSTTLLELMEVVLIGGM